MSIDSIGERIRAARKDRNLNQTALADRIGVTQPAVANWESGVHDPRRVMIAKLAEALGVEPGWLASGARSAHERDKHPAAAYLRRILVHTPVISLKDAARASADDDFDPHPLAEDYIPMTYGADEIFAVFVNDPAMNLVFPGDTLVVVDYSDTQPEDGAYVLAVHDGASLVRRWRADPARLECAGRGAEDAPTAMTARDCIIGRVCTSIRFH